MMICEIKKVLAKSELNFGIKKYIVFCITLIFIFYMQFNNADNFIVSAGNMPYKISDINSINNRNYTTDNNDKMKEDLNKLDDSLSKSSIDNNQFDTDSINSSESQDKDQEIIINRDNYVYSLDKILSDPLRYNGRKVEISGFVYRDSELNNEEFIIGRYMMVCCAADLQIAGIKCAANEKDNMNLDNNTWVKVQGTISSTDNEAVIEVYNIEIDNNPDKQYVYPF